MIKPGKNERGWVNRFTHAIGRPSCHLLGRLPRHRPSSADPASAPHSISKEYGVSWAMSE